MQIKTIKVSEKGQIAIPKEMRDNMGIKEGEELLLFQKEDQILIQKAKKVSKLMEDSFSDILVFNQNSLKEVWGNKEDDYWNTYLKKK